jgi:hypothetical protein
MTTQEIVERIKQYDQAQKDGLISMQERQAFMDALVQIEAIDKAQGRGH